MIMKKALIGLITVTVALGTLSLTIVSQENNETSTKFPSYHPNFPPPDDAPKIFKLSQNYPDTYVKENYPWLTIDFKAKPTEYMNAVLRYCLEGNIETNFNGEDNPIRKWYHAPWLHYGSNGREYINGLTRERGTPKFEIHRNQNVELENWAVGLYNAPGGYALGKVWQTTDNYPAPEKSTFPEGTATFKLLFTDGPVDKVPFLDGTIEWEANIYPDSRTRDIRINRTVRLIQIDIAVKDNRAKETGWVFGTFVYDASKLGENAWDKMVPVGLSWGDDPKETSMITKDGAFVNPKLRETMLNAALVEDLNTEYTNQAYIRYHGLGGRLNGPVDNPISSCISCHGQAATFKDHKPFNVNSGRPMPMANFSLTRSDFPLTEFNRYFRNVSPGAMDRKFDDLIYITTDYSLQIAAGIRNFYQSKRDEKVNELTLLLFNEESNKDNKDLVKYLKYLEELPEVNRGE